MTLRLITGEKVDWVILATVVIGFRGVVTLLAPGADFLASTIWGLVLLAAALSEAFGSFIAQRLQLPADPLVSAVIQMVFAGALTLAGGVLLGERVEWDAVSVGGVAAFVYLVVSGSIWAYTAFVWLLQTHLSPRPPPTHIVNPVVALFLGWALLDEPLTGRALFRALMIVGAVAALLWREARSYKPSRNKRLEP